MHRFLPPLFVELLQTDRVIKVGHDLNCDALALRNSFNIELYFTLDTQALWEDRKLYRCLLSRYYLKYEGGQNLPKKTIRYKFCSVDIISEIILFRTLYAPAINK